jgi:TRAP-type C4-dicarboxylate transport system permease small subunit
LLLGYVALGVVARAMGEPLIWFVSCPFLMVWLAVFGWILASRKRIHVRIRYFQDHLPARASDGRAVIQAALAIFGILIAWYGVGLVAKNHDLNALSLPISMAWMYVPMVLAGIVTAVQGACEVGETIQRSRIASTVHDEAGIE